MSAKGDLLGKNAFFDLLKLFMTRGRTRRGFFERRVGYSFPSFRALLGDVDEELWTTERLEDGDIGESGFMVKDGLKKGWES